jgi:hypothetical protein
VMAVVRVCTYTCFLFTDSTVDRLIKD